MSCRIYSDTDEPERDSQGNVYGQIDPHAAAKAVEELMNHIPSEDYHFQARQIKSMDQIGQGIDPPRFYQGETYPLR